MNVMVTRKRFKIFMRGVPMGVDPCVAFRTRSHLSVRRYPPALQGEPHEHADDAGEALIRDWYVVGDDLQQGVKKFESEFGEVVVRRRIPRAS
jgi:hypothetical protein